MPDNSFFGLNNNDIIVQNLRAATECTFNLTRKTVSLEEEEENTNILARTERNGNIVYVMALFSLVGHTGEKITTVAVYGDKSQFQTDKKGEYDFSEVFGDDFTQFCGEVYGEDKLQLDVTTAGKSIMLSHFLQSRDNKKTSENAMIDGLRSITQHVWASLKIDKVILSKKQGATKKPKHGAAKEIDNSKLILSKDLADKIILRNETDDEKDKITLLHQVSKLLVKQLKALKSKDAIVSQHSTDEITQAVNEMKNEIGTIKTLFCCTFFAILITHSLRSSTSINTDKLDADQDRSSKKARTTPP